MSAEERARHVIAQFDAGTAARATEAEVIAVGDVFPALRGLGLIEGTSA